MENKVPYPQRNFRGKYKVSMLIFAILVIATVLLWVAALRSNRVRSIAEYDKTVDAPLISYTVLSNADTDPYTLEIMYVYKYEDENGVIYEGTVRSYADYETADKTIADGKTVKINIDGKGNSILADTDTSETTFITLLVLSIILSVGTAVFFVIFLIPKNR